MHPTVMTILADERAEHLRSTARRRGPVVRAPRRRLALHRPRRSMFIARTGS